ncbi:MAG: hypothetical protein ACI835_002350 [Planctomycetota bacterium]|jgi:hypothetical protein
MQLPQETLWDFSATLLLTFVATGPAAHALDGCELVELYLADVQSQQDFGAAVAI